MTGEELLFREISVNGTQSHYFPKSKLMLSARENNLAVHFTIVNFDDNHHARFAYRINDTIWNSLGEQQTLHLTNLAPGDYQLEVVATLKSGERIPNLLSFRIAPPFWMTAWFIALCGALAIMLAYALYRWRIAHVQQRANLDKLLSQTEMKALHAQMNPHFIFNSLNSIREMILNNETREASRFLANFAHLIRITLDQSRQSFISLRHTIDYLQRYIEMEKIRNPDFHFTMTVDESLDPDEIILPPLLIQPFIENAIWHGMDGDERDLHILVQFRKDGEQLVCTIEDDGVGIEHALKSKQRNNGGHESVSIANIQRRIELLNRKHDLQSSIAIRDKNSGTSADTGTIVRITLPLEINER
jgi:two-component sensor histidine kinase